MMRLDAPFPWFGGKRRIAPVVWQHFGQVDNYVEPFFGSGAVLLGRPQPIAGNETINDLDGLVANFWRAIKHRPEETAEWADNPVNENDLHARHVWLLSERDSLAARLEGDPEWCDAKIAGWWVWGISCWIGSGFCSGNGPWQVIDRQLVHLSGNGQGVNRQLVHLSSNGQGVNRQRRESLIGWFEVLSERLRNVRVCCGEWTRVLGPSVTFKQGTTAVLLDPPYGEQANRQGDLYRLDDAAMLSLVVREWAIDAGQHSDMRIALCGYEGEHEMPPNWNKLEWDAGVGYGGQARERSHNGERERIWFSPACQCAQYSLPMSVEGRKDEAAHQRD
jgi:hypothetical protein